MPSAARRLATARARSPERGMRQGCVRRRCCQYCGRRPSPDTFVGRAAREVVMTRALSIGRRVGLSFVLAGAWALAGACNQAPQPVVPPPATSPVKPPEPAPPTADAGAARPKMIANPDGLSLAERIAKREAAEKKVAAQLAVG